MLEFYSVVEFVVAALLRGWKSRAVSFLKIVLLVGSLRFLHPLRCHTANREGTNKLCNPSTFSVSIKIDSLLATYELLDLAFSCALLFRQRGKSLFSSSARVPIHSHKVCEQRDQSSLQFHDHVSHVSCRLPTSNSNASRATIGLAITKIRCVGSSSKP